MADKAPEGLDEFIAGGAPDRAPASSPASSGAPAGLDEFIAPEMNEEKFGSLGQQAATAAEGLGEGLLGPVAPALERAVGVSPEGIRGRKETNPVTHGIATAAGFGAGALAGTGEAALVGKLGEGAMDLARLAPADSLAGNAAYHAFKTGVETAAIQSGDEVSKLILQDPKQSAASAIADVGLAGLLGGAGGGLFGAVSPLWKAASGSKAGEFIQDFRGRIAEKLGGESAADTLTRELSDYHAHVTGMNDETFGVNGLKAREIEKGLPEMSPKIQAHANELTDRLSEAITHLQDDPYVGKLAKAADQYQTTVSAPGATPGSIFNAGDRLKAQLQEWGKFNKTLVPLAERDFRQTAQALARDVRLSLEDPKVWGRAGESQQAINRAFGKLKPALEDFEKKFTVKQSDGSRVVDPGKVNSYLNQVGKQGAKVRQDLLGRFLEAGQEFHDTLSDTHVSLGLEPPAAPSMQSAKESLETPSGGAGLADAVLRHGFDALSTGTGAVIGHGPGAIIGSLVGHTLSPMVRSVLPGILGPLIEKSGSASGLKSAFDFGKAVAKGTRAVDRATSAVFERGSASVLDSKVAQSDRDRLEKLVDETQKDPQKLLRVGGDVGYYLPAHHSALASTAEGAMGYLAQQKPKEKKLGPLDRPMKPTEIEKADYNRTLAIAQEPLSILKRVKDGTLLPKDLVDLNALYPQLYGQMRQKLTDAMIGHLADEGSVDYRTRISLSLFLDQPLDATLTPAGIQLAQASFAPKEAPPQPAGKTKQGTSSLGKTAAQYQTAAQSREAARSKN